jgi:hypothetical protein
MTKMRGFLLALSATLASAATIAREAMPLGAAIISGLEPRGSPKKHHKDKWGCNKPEYRHSVTIRASKNDTDDISADLLWAFHKANHGGTVYLKEGLTYIIGKKLDLSFLNDVHLRLDGEIKFTDDIEYWQENNFYYDFQKSITFWVWGGEKIKIYSETGNGVLNGNGQAWYVQILWMPLKNLEQSANAFTQVQWLCWPRDPRQFKHILQAHPLPHRQRNPSRHQRYQDAQLPLLDQLQHPHQ